jgi:hygromycin-B 7''-O-kinase
MPILPVVRDRAHYSELFKKSHRWSDAMEWIMRTHGLSGEPVRAALGSHIVYRVGDLWIKMMAPLFAKDMAFEVAGLKSVQGRLSVATPVVLAQGTLEDWPYVVMSHVDGAAVRDLWRTYSVREKVQLAQQIAQVAKEISACPADPVVSGRFDWQSFISGQYENCETQQQKKLLPAPWLKNLTPFLRSFELQEFLTPQPLLLHADLTFDHFLVNEGKVSGIIDMADCQVGHFEYELVAPCAFIFKSEPATLRSFLENCGFEEAQLNQRFSEKLLAWAIMHRYFSVVTWFKHEMNDVEVGDFSELADRVFPLAY